MIVSPRGAGFSKDQKKRIILGSLGTEYAQIYLAGKIM